MSGQSGNLWEARPTDATMKPMLLRTLGGLGLVGCDFHQGKPLLVLCYLTVEGPKPRRFLAEFFWPGTADPLNTLSVTLGRLRRACPGGGG